MEIIRIGWDLTITVEKLKCLDHLISLFNQSPVSLVNGTDLYMIRDITVIRDGYGFIKGISGAGHELIIHFRQIDRIYIIEGE